MLLVAYVRSYCMSRDDDYRFEEEGLQSYILVERWGQKESTPRIRYWQRHGYEVSPNLGPPSRLCLFSVDGKRHFGLVLVG
jgi:hypothetical protein